MTKSVYLAYHNSVGYFVSYKSKGEENFSEIYLQAKQYKSLGATMNRYGIHTINSLSSQQNAKQILIDVDKQIKEQSFRKKKLSNIIDENYVEKIDWDSINIFKYGKIEKLTFKENKTLVKENASEDVYNILKKMEKKYDKYQEDLKKRILKNTSCIDVIDDINNEFWD